jgi:hypothetical protein
MQFGRVEGVVEPVDVDGELRLRLTVYLETGHRLEIVREDVLAVLRSIAEPDDLVWHADQWTQETIGVELAEAGWEVIGAGELAGSEPGALARSASYAVRRLG